MTNSADPDQLASSDNNKKSTLFAKTGHVMFSKRRVKHILLGTHWNVVLGDGGCWGMVWAEGWVRG